MNRRWFLLGAAALLVTAGVAEARMHAPYRGHRIVLAATGAIDSFAQPSGAYSFRKLRSAYAGSAVKLQRVDLATLDIGFVGNDFDTAAATAFCTTACTINTWYDQSGNARNLVQATAANQPAYVANCQGALPCMQFTLTGQSLASAAFTPTTGVMSKSVVANRVSGINFVTFFRSGGATGNRVNGQNTTTQWIVAGSAGTIVPAAPNAAWHAAQVVFNGASSVVNIDGVETTGSLTGGVTASPLIIIGSTGSTFNESEVVFWDGYALTPAERTALSQNQRDYWMPYTLDTFVSPSGAYSFRKLKSTYTGPAIRIRRASDNAETDIGFLGFVPGLGSPLDVAAANAHCAATTCSLVTWYDQSGNARHATQATPANQPALIFNCKGSLPCVQSVGTTTRFLTGATLTLTSAVYTASGVGNRATGTDYCTFIGWGAPTNFWAMFGAENNWFVGPSPFLKGAAANAAWHSGIGVTGASAVIRIDGAETAGAVSANTSTGALAVSGGGGATTCLYGEAIVWGDYGLTATERAALGANQKSFWGTP